MIIIYLSECLIFFKESALSGCEKQWDSVLILIDFSCEKNDFNAQKTFVEYLGGKSSIEEERLKRLTTCLTSVRRGNYFLLFFVFNNQYYCVNNNA